MKKILSLFIFLFAFVSFTFAQEEDFEYEQIQKVIANGGLVMRKAPSTSAPKIQTIPRNTMILTFANSALKEEEIAGLKGLWYSTYYKGEYGYVFGGFLSDDVDYDASRIILEEYHVIYNIGEDIKEIYDAPNEDATVVDLVGEGQVLYVIDSKKLLEMNRKEQSGWVKVRNKEVIGYIHSDYLISYEGYGLFLESQSN